MLSPIRILAALVPLAGFAATLPLAEIETTIDMARSAPGEFAADGLLRIAALEQLTPSVRAGLAEEAFGRAAEAQQPFKRRSAMANRSANAGFLEHAFGQDLDALSLRVRAVQVMLPLDPGKARRLFSEIPSLDLPFVSCDDFMVFDVDRYYDALAEVTRHAFTPKEVHEGAAYQFFLQRIAVVASPAQIAPAIRAILSAGLSDAGFSGAVAALTAALRKTLADDRSFTYSLPAMGEQVLALIEECRRRGTPPRPVAEAYRRYLVANLSAPRCADDDIFPGSGMVIGLAYGPPLDTRSTEAIRLFNQSVRMAPLQPIEAQEATPSDRAGAASGLRGCESVGCQALARRYRSLVFDSAGTAVPSVIRETLEWQRQMQAFVAALGDWQDAAGPEAAQQFREKCALYADLIGLLPGGRGREPALRAMLEYLQRSRSQPIRRIEWLLPVNTLIGRIGLDPLAFGRIPDELLHSEDAVIALYAELEKVAPRPAEAILRLM